MDRHQLYQALYLALGHSPISSLDATPASLPASSSQQSASKAKRDAPAQEPIQQLPVLLTRTAHQMLVEQVHACLMQSLAA